MSFANVLEAEHPGRLRFVAARRDLFGDALKRNVGEREARGSEDEAAEEGQKTPLDICSSGLKSLIGASPPSQPARHARPPRRNMARESRMVLLPTRSSTASSSLASGMRLDRSGPSSSTRSAPNSSSAAKRSLLRLVATTRTPALTAMLIAALPKEEGPPRIIKLCPLAIPRLRNRQVMPSHRFPESRRDPPRADRTR